MTTAREAFEAKKLAQKYGIIGKVAASYRTAGFEVKIESTSKDAPYNFTAVRKGEKLLVKVFEKQGKVPTGIVEKLASQAKEKGGKPVLVLYGAGPKSSKELLDAARSSSVSIRRFRA